MGDETTWMALAAGAALAGGVVGYLVSERKHRRALRRLSAWIRTGADLSAEDLPRDLRPLARSIEATQAALRAAEQEKHSASTARRLARVSSRLAHDIRSPIAALEVFLSAGRITPETHAEVLRPALARLRGVASLLTGSQLAREIVADARGTAAGADEDPQPVLLSAVLEAAVSAARMTAGVRAHPIEFEEDRAPYGVFVLVPPQAFGRGLDLLASRLLAPGADASSRLLRLGLLAAGERATCRLEAVGKAGTGGSSSRHQDAEERVAEAVARLRDVVARAGGAIERAGTAIEITLPIATPPSWFLPEIRLPAASPVVVVDDDPWVHRMWEKAFADAEAHPEIVHLYSPEELERRLRGQDRAAGLFLVDDGYPGSETSGLDLLEGLREVVPRAVLVTGRWEDPQVRSRSLALGLRLLPKNLVPRIPIVGSGAGSPAAGEGEGGEVLVQPDAVLLDDHVWIRKGWELSAARAGKRLLTCRSMQEFSALQRGLDRATVIFIDSDLRDEMPGERFAWSLFDAGFTELYLATGFEAERFAVLPWLKGVQGKDPPDWTMLEKPGEDPLEVFEREARP